ncbi:MAG: hypothetical protein HY231_07240 [Acidobacteria bacterium]|nr:hypothetical protein [Acidobacteriota bacterium]
MAKKLLSGWSLLFSTDMFLPFVFGGVALGVLGNAIFTMLTNWLTTSNGALARISLGAFLFIIFSGLLLKKYLNRHRETAPLVGKKQPEMRKGLILLVSQEAVCRKAIRWHQKILSKCWLVCSTKSNKIGERLKEEFENESTDFEIISITDKDVFDPLVLKEKVEEIYQNLPQFFTEQDVILDFTGMTATASVGAVLACFDKDRPIQYIPAPYNEKLEAIEPLDPIEVKIDWSIIKS